MVTICQPFVVIDKLSRKINIYYHYITSDYKYYYIHDSFGRPIVYVYNDVYIYQQPDITFSEEIYNLDDDEPNGDISTD